MSSYEYRPGTWHPVLAGVVAGAIAAIVAALVSLPLRSPDEVVANSLSVVLVALALGAVAGMLWRRLRATSAPTRSFGLAMGGGFLMACVAITIGDQLFLSNLITYAIPLAAIIFITLGFLTPLLAGITGSPWFAAIPIVIALGLGVGLFGRGNVASGDLTLDDVATVTTTAATGGSGVDTTAATTTTTASVGSSGSLSIPADLADSYTVATGIATYSVEEELQGLATVGVGTTESVSGSIVPGGAFSFTIDLQSFASDQNRRDGRVREWFQEFPEGTFSGESFALPASAEVGEVVSFEVTGDMTVNGITLPATWAIDARIEADGSLSVTGETFIVLSDFDVPVMNSGFIVMEDGATIEVAFSATP